MPKFRAQILWIMIALLAASPLAALAVPADEPVTLSLLRLLEEARRANPELLAARKRWEAAQARVPMARGFPAPKIGVEWESIPRGTVKLNKAEAMYSLVQSLPFPGKLSLRHQVALSEAQMAAAGFKQAEWDVTTMLKTTYYDLFLLDREVELQRQQQVWFDQAVATARARYETGAASQTEFLRAQGEALQAATQVTVLTHRRQAMGAHLNHLLNRPAHGAIGSPAPVELLPVPSSPEQLLQQAEQSQPELAVFRAASERAGHAWRLAKRELWPDLETMLELRNPAMGPIGPWDLSLALVLPFWFWTKQHYGVKAALADKESAEAAYQAVRNEIARRIHEHWHEAAASSETVALCRDHLLPLAEQAVASALAAYQSGQGPYADVLMALQQWSQQHRTYYEHLVSLEQHVVLLEQDVGVPLRPAHHDTASMSDKGVTP